MPLMTGQIAPRYGSDARKLRLSERAMMTSFVKSVAFAAAAVMMTVAGAQAAGMLADAKGMTLYTFDKDAGGVSACYTDCAVKWPPYLGKVGDKMEEGWTQIKRTDGTMQWAYDGKPTYFFKADVKPGEMAGDGMGGVWHIIKE